MLLRYREEKSRFVLPLTISSLPLSLPLPPFPSPSPSPSLPPSLSQVLQLLVEVGVDDLQLVIQEKITGDILLELNEDELESELGIKRKIHRLKVMKVVNGSKPITDYLSIPNSMDALC